MLLNSQSYLTSVVLSDMVTELMFIGKIKTCDKDAIQSNSLVIIPFRLHISKKIWLILEFNVNVKFDQSWNGLFC